MPSHKPLLCPLLLAAACAAVLAAPAAAQRRPVRDPSLHQLIAVPPGINYGLPAVSPSTMLRMLGRPGELVEDCKTLEVPNQQLSAMMVTRNVRHLKVKGLRPAVAVLERIMDRVKADLPVLFEALSTEGMLCVRRVRTAEHKPKSKSFSNHSWGIAIDLRVNGQLDEPGNDRTQRGLVMLYPYFRAERFYWGGAFKTEDSMHFEASDELMREWMKDGSLK
jgi:hypothetical protein